MTISKFGIGVQNDVQKCSGSDESSDAQTDVNEQMVHRDDRILLLGDNGEKSEVTSDVHRFFEMIMDEEK